ncbi:MAG: 3-dehydroquinate synthase [Pseudomonadota bacterium]
MPADQFDRICVELGRRAYDVLIGAGLLAQVDSLACSRLGKTAKAFILTDTNVASYHLETITKPLAAAGRLRGTATIPAGEASKSFSSLETVCSSILDANVERHDYIIALGGGVVGDLAGVASALVRRGVSYVQIPTSLLAQVDSSVGGKTGINTSHGKNLIGAFHQPHLVLADTDVLNTLPTREIRAGYAEVVKYGLLGDRQFYDWLDENLTKILDGDRQALQYAVKRSVEMKAEIVARDETEQGDRALLNLGHTFGHALEAWTGYSDRLLHGEGVAVGMCLAFQLSEEVGFCPPQTAARVIGHLKRAGLPTSITEIETAAPADAATLVRLMGQDKKVRDGQLTFIMAHDIGRAFVTRELSSEKVQDFLTRHI